MLCVMNGRVVRMLVSQHYMYTRRLVCAISQGSLLLTWRTQQSACLCGADTRAVLITALNALG
jgi:hypothetical protein